MRISSLNIDQPPRSIKYVANDPGIQRIPAQTRTRLIQHQLVGFQCAVCDHRGDGMLRCRLCLRGIRLCGTAHGYTQPVIGSDR